MRTVIHNCGPIITFDSEAPVVGKDMLNDKWILSAGKAIIISGEVIEEVVDSSEALDDYQSHVAKGVDKTEIINANGRAIIPGLIDSHTHIVWGGDRSREVRLKQQGHTYAQIAALGGGINSTVAMTNSLSERDLFILGKRRLITALKNGSTYIETKSGYGLDSANELKLLRVAKLLDDDIELPGIDSTWLGAHAIPDNQTLESYTEEIINEQLPKVAKSGLARSADVFCEPGWFGLDESRAILAESRKHGLRLRMHIDEFCDGGGGMLAAELGVDTADHAHYTSEDARSQMKLAGVNTGFLPGTPYSLGSEWPNFHHMIELEAPWTIATDYNPNNQVLSLPFAASCIVQRCGVDPLAALAACTVNAAFITPHKDNLKHGVIAKGAVANLNILQTPQWESWCLTPGHSPFDVTFMNGNKISHDY